MIEGKLINLRAIEMTDLDRYHAWINDREVTRHLFMRYPMSYAAEEAWISNAASTPGSYDNTGSPSRRRTGCTSAASISTSPSRRTARRGSG